MNRDGLRLAFAGTPELAASILNSLINSNKHQIDFIITRPDRPAGRGRKNRKSPVKILAENNSLEIIQPETPADIDPHGGLAGTDVLVVAAFGMILPADILDRPRLGCINVHTSLLPRWRGAAPIQRAIQAGDSKTGITIMQIEEELDSGDIFLQRECKILPADTSGTLHGKLAVLGGECLLEALDGLSAGTITPVKQNQHLATYASKVTREEAFIDWELPAAVLERMIRAFNPSPAAHTELNGINMKVWQADIVKPGNKNDAPGKIIDCSNSGIIVATSMDALRIRQLQPAGRKIMTVKDFLNGHPGFASQA